MSCGFNFQGCVLKESGFGKYLEVYGRQSQCWEHRKWMILDFGGVSRKHRTGLGAVADQWNLLHSAAFPSVLWDEWNQNRNDAGAVRRSKRGLRNLPEVFLGGDWGGGSLWGAGDTDGGALDNQLISQAVNQSLGGLFISALPGWRL